MTRRAKTALLVLALIAATAIIWIAGGFLWPRPQFDRPGAPWSGDSPPAAD
ncbi:hypothetical protein BH20GEM1_BH20GEM1_05180 [soil metagenome]